ncbi:Cell division protein FtsA [Elusimicrobium minutum Pei191]|uniref:Cell division protein FtsA n=1 Tax=Elusimicrobium minutum (strain Pei191) TaxID=445932 RepID=B2KCH5_ELUMP|nr:cell division protein FtsA [Elusimicrobium minutum]ACC98096.1 Cell division protein FtsA [Elusimicrobium minutum Pei191]
MSKTNIIAGLDVGSGKMTCVAAVQDFETNTLRVEAANSISCKGLRAGVVLDIRETSAAAVSLLTGLERECGKDIGALFLGVRGSHLESFTNHGTYNISRADKEITINDMQLAIENAKAIPIKNDNEIINVIPQSFAIDKEKGIINPEGMEGSLLEVDVHVTTGSSTHLNNLVKSIQKPGFRIDGTFYGLVPLADMVLTQEEKEIGSMLIDLGGETMSVGIYIDGVLRFSRDIPFGCDLITSDLARLLHTPRQSAKEIKERYGVAFPTFLEDEGEIPVPTLDGRSMHNVKKSFILDIIQPRVEELFEEVKKVVDRSGYKDFPVVGVLSGGGSLMPGVTNVCVNTLGLREVRTGMVSREAIIGDEQFFDPKYSTALALVAYASQRGMYEEYNRASFEQKTGLFSKIGKIFKGVDIFGS